MCRWNRTFALLALSSAGCTLLFEYPPETAERGEELCANGRDDDLDGLIDCEDPGCDGHCPEESAEACTNGRDDDGDGLVDLHDGRCWPWAPFVVERCSSVEGTHFAPALDGRGLSWTGTGSFVADPRSSGAYVMAAVGEPSWLASTIVATGAVEGMTLEASVHVDERASVTLRLAPDSRAPLDSDGLALELVEGGSDVELRRAGSRALARLPRSLLPLAAGWHRVELVVTAGRVLVSVDDSTLDFGTLGCRAADPICIGEAWYAATPVRFAWSAEPAGGQVMVSDVVLERPRFDPCGHRVPQLEGELLGAAHGAGRLCVLTTRTDAGGARLGGFRAWRSIDGLDWEGPFEIEAEELAGAAAIAWDTGSGTAGCPGGGFRGGAIVPNLRIADTIDEVRSIESCECGGEWTIGPDLAATDTPDASWVSGGLHPGALDYAIGPFGLGGAVVHELHFSFGQRDVVRSLSPRGAPGSFARPEHDEAPPLPSPPELTMGGVRAGRHVLRVGRDRVLLFGSGRDLRLMAEHASRWSPRAQPLLAPSGIEGSFDASVMRLGLLLAFELPADRRATWLLLYSGPSTQCEGCSATGAVRVGVAGTQEP